MRRGEGDNHTLSSGFETNLTIFEGHNIQKERYFCRLLIMYLTQKRRGGEKGRVFFFLRLRRRLLQILKWAEKCLLLQHRILLRVSSCMGRRGVKAELSCRSKHPSLGVGSPVFVGVGLDYFIRNRSWNNVVLRVLVIR